MHELGRTLARIAEQYFGVAPEQAFAGLRVLLIDARAYGATHELGPACEPFASGGAQITIASEWGADRLRASGLGRRCHRIVASLGGGADGEGGTPVAREPISPRVETVWRAATFDLVIALDEAPHERGESDGVRVRGWESELRSTVAIDGVWIDATLHTSARATMTDATLGDFDREVPQPPVDPEFAALESLRVALEVMTSADGAPSVTWCRLTVSRRITHEAAQRNGAPNVTSTMARLLPGGRTRCVDPSRIERAIARARAGDAVLAPPVTEAAEAEHGGTAPSRQGVPAVWSALRRWIDDLNALDVAAASVDVDVRALPFAAGWVAGPTAPLAEGASPSPARSVEPEADADVDVLAIVAHPDDEVLELGGTLARLVDEGATVHVVVATAGEGGRDARPHAPASVGADGPSSTDLGEVRRREHETALEVLLRAGATVSTLGLADTGKYVDTSRQQPMGSAEALRRWGVDEVVGRIVEVIRRTRPLLVLGHASTHDSTWSLHGHHLALGVATSVAIVAAADARVVCQDRALAPWRTREHRVVIAAETAERSPPQDVIAVPIDPERKAAALAAHVSQHLSLELPIAKLRAASPAVLHEYFASGVELRSRHARAPRSWLASLAARQRGPGSRWERLLAGPPTLVERLWGTPASRRWPMPSFTPHDRAALAAALVEAEDAAHANQAELAARRAFANDETVAVVTGQQVGIFGGPAFTLGKALEAWTHARALRAQGIAAIPVFWMATFDHDLDEVAEIYAGRAVDPRHARLRHEGRGRVVGPLPLGSAVADALAVVERRLAGTPHHAWTMARLRERWTAHTTFGVAFAGLLRDLVAADPSSGVEDDLGIVWLDPSSRAIAALGREVVAAALFDRTRVQGALDVGARALHDLGFAAIVTREVATSGRVHSEVFLTDEDGVRSALWFEPDGGWSTARGRRYERAELEALLHEAPERLTPSVLLRPLVQARVLPVTAFVAGPTELRYLAQLGPLHRVLGLVPPRVLPRRRLAFVGHADVARLAAAGVTPQLATRAPDFARHLLRGTPRPKPASAVGESAPEVQTAVVTYRTAFLATTGALAATRRLAIRTTEARPELAHAPRHAVARPASEAAALVASCEALRSAAEADGLTKTAGLARMLGNALAGGPPERAGPRAIRGVWRILRAMRREVDRRDGDTSAAVAALERSSPPRLPTLHTVDRDLGVVDLMAAAGPSLVPTLAARLVATGDGGHGPFVFEDEPSSREVLGDVAGSTLIVLDPPTPTARSGAGIAVAHPWTDERSRRALRAALHTAAADSFVRNGVEARPAEGVTPFVSSPSSVHTTKARRVAVLGMGGLGGSGKVAGEVALLYAQAGHEVWHWTGEGSRWAAEFDRFETDVEAEGSAASRDPDPQSQGPALTPQPKRPVHEAMPVPETPSLRDEARFEADVEGLTAAIVQRVQRERIDVVHVHYADVLLDAVLRAKARVEPSRRFAVMVTLHGSDVTALSSTSPRARALCAMLEHCDAVTTPSRFLASEAVQRLGIPAPLVVPNAIEPREHDPDAGHALRDHFRGDGAIVVAHASNLRPIKRPLDAARVVASLRARGVNARFVAAGEGPLRGELADEVASNPHLREAASLIGACSTATLREVFAAADVVLVTSESESFSLVALEALAAGTLVVGTRCGGLEELLTDTFEGDADALLAPVGDVETLTQRVLALASDPERVARLQRRAVTRTRRIHPRELQRDAYLALLERVTAGALD